MTQTALVFAGRSFLGRHLNVALRDRGLRVLTTARRPVHHESCLICDLTDQEAVRRTIAECRPDLIFQCGAVTGTENAVPRDYYQTHVLGAIHVLSAAAEFCRDSTVVLLGSAAEYGPVPASALPVPETFHASPSSWFGASKLAQTQAVRVAAAEWGLRAIVARPFNVIGPGIPSYYLAGALVRRLSTAPSMEEITVANGMATRDWVDVRDVAAALVALAIEAAPPAGTVEVYNIASGIERSVREVAEKLCALAGGGRVLRDLGPGISRSGIQRSCGDASKLRSAVGWAPRVEWEKSLEDLWEWWMANG